MKRLRLSGSFGSVRHGLSRRYDVESIVDGEWLRVVVELPDDPPDVIVVTVIAVE